uniref:Uncharacterized protein n=2 Tax=Caenorhabditis tropicalis TaxID=1561998 RepID=A0A1I7TGU7_9PELO
MTLVYEFDTREKANSYHDSMVKAYPSSTGEVKEHRDNMDIVPCRRYKKSREYADGRTDTVGYKLCCEMHGWCGLSGWYIFLIIVCCLIVLAIGGALLWFCYLNRFFGGKEKEDEEKKEDYSNTEDVGSVEISVATY